MIHCHSASEYMIYLAGGTAYALRVARAVRLGSGASFFTAFKI